jgi:hypothetical protein
MLAQTGQPRPSDWYVIGRIAEHLGLRDDAIRAYRKVTRSPDVTLDLDADVPAAKRLKRL